MEAVQKAIRLAGVLRLPVSALLLLPTMAMADEYVGVLKEITVTGTRLDVTPGQTTQELQVYTADDITRSGQVSVTEFLNTLPVVSTVDDPFGLQTVNGVTGVRLHGLPFDATLILIDGRHAPVSAGGAFNNIFDLNNIPVAAIERIEILPQGSSAIYGSDAIGGVINIILKKNFEGVAASGRYGGADHTQEGDMSAAWGTSTTHGSASVIASYQVRTQLLGQYRDLTANADFTRFGGGDSRLTVGNPGNVFSSNGANLPGLNAPFAAVPAGFTGPPSVGEFAGTAGQLNKLSLLRDAALSPRAHRATFLANGAYNLSDDVELDVRLLYTHNQHDGAGGPAGELNGSPSFQTFTVSAANPFNPFGTKVGIGYVFPGLINESFGNDFFLPTIALKGIFGDSWSWEVAGWASLERNRIAFSNLPNSAAVQAALNSSDPATALNPFVAGAPGSQQLVNSVLFTDHQQWNSNTYSGSAVLRGNPLVLPSGDVSVAIGSEFDLTELEIRDSSAVTSQTLRSPSVSRRNYAVFGETRIPLIGRLFDPENDLLALTGAERYDRYSGIGGNATSQAGAIAHPLPALSISANWGEAFKAPSLYQLYNNQVTFVQSVLDPLTHTLGAPTITNGGNPRLKPETGESHSFTAVYKDGIVPGLTASVSNWAIREAKAIRRLSPQVIADNAGAFPGFVTRAASCAAGPPCPITSISNTFVNFGTLDVAGLDYFLSYKFSAAGIDWLPELSATETYRYKAALQPGLPATNRVSAGNDDFNWAPRWKARLALTGSKGPWSAWLAGRYVGPYRDYDPLPNGAYLTLGRVWYVDANFKYRLGGIGGDFPWAPRIALQIGAVNLFNRQPQFSNLFHGVYGFDLLQADMRGRFVYAQIDAEW